MKKDTKGGFSNIEEIQNILTAMSKEIHNANSSMNKSDLALMFRKADSIRDMAKYIVASQNAMQSTNSCLTPDSSEK